MGKLTDDQVGHVAAQLAHNAIGSARRFCGEDMVDIGKVLSRTAVILQAATTVADQELTPDVKRWLEQQVEGKGGPN